MAITRKDTAALAGASAEEPVAEQPRPLFISEGVRQDLEIHGKAVDPATGDALELNRETGEVTATPRVPE
jgi:hypothetical protein